MKSARTEIAGEIEKPGIGTGIMALRADHGVAGFDHFGNMIIGSAERTIKGVPVVAGQQSGRCITLKHGEKDAIATANKPAPKNKTEETGEAKRETVSESITVSIVKKVKPVEKKHGDSYGLGFLIGFSIMIAITYAVFRKKSKKQDRLYGN